MTTATQPKSIAQWARHLMVYGLGVGAQSGLSFLLIFIHTRRIKPSEYGILELLNRGQDVLILVVLCGFGVAALAFYQFEVSQPERRARVFSTALGGILLNSLVILTVLWPLAAVISEWLFGTRQYDWAVRVILVLIPLELAFQIGLISLQARFKSTLYVVASAGRLILGIAANLVLVYWLNWGLWGIFLATLIHTGTAAFVLGAVVFQQSGWSFEWKLWNELLRYGMPFVPGGVFLFVLNNGDRYFLNVFHGPEDVGVYAVGFKLGSALLFVVLAPFMKVWSAMMVETANSPSGPARISRMATYLATVYLYAGLLLSLAAPFLVRWVAEPGYWQAHRFIPLVVVAYLFWSLSVVGDAPFYAKKKTKIKPLLLGAACVFSVASNALLIPRFAGIGAATALVITFVLMLALTMRAGHRYLPIPYEFGRLSTALAVAVVLYLAGRYASGQGFLSDFTVTALALLVFPAALLALRFWHTDETGEMGRLLRVARARMFSDPKQVL